MTHYWWMHWFWITCCFSFTICQVSFSTLHSEVTEPTLSFSSPSVISIFKSESSRSAKAISGSVSIPPKISDSSKNVSMETNISKTNNRKPSSPITFSNASSVNPVTVINPSNLTDTTDNQNLTTTLGDLNTTENVTFTGDEVTYNQSFIQNSERIAIDAENVDVDENLSAAGITGITLGCVVIVGIICGVSYLLYRNRGFNRPQVLNDRCSNPDSSGYIDDTSVRDNSEEMYSLDNDSFLNSLEAMTIQNYWTDTVKHTKL